MLRTVVNNQKSYSTGGFIDGRERKNTSAGDH